MMQWLIFVGGAFYRRFGRKILSRLVSILLTVDNILSDGIVQRRIWKLKEIGWICISGVFLAYGNIELL